MDKIDIDMLNDDLDMDYDFNDGSDADLVVEPEANSLVNHIWWSAITGGSPQDNQQLREMFELVGGMTPETAHGIFEELWDIKMTASSSGLVALQRLNDLMEDVETFNFAELVRIIDEKTPLDMFYDHSQDFEIHLIEEDRNLLAEIPDMLDALEQLAMRLNNIRDMLLNRIANAESSHLHLTSRVNEHIADGDAHITGDEKETLINAAANFNNPFYMQGTRIEYDFPHRQGQGQGQFFLESAYRGNTPFAERRTDFTDRNRVTTETWFWLETETIAVREIFRTLDDGRREMTIERIDN